MKRMFFAFCALLSALAAGAQPYRDAALTTDERVEDLLGRMTREEKVAQLLCPLGWQYDENRDSLGTGMLWATHRADPWTGRTLPDMEPDKNYSFVLKNINTQYAFEVKRPGGYKVIEY